VNEKETFTTDWIVTYQDVSYGIPILPQPNYYKAVRRFLRTIYTGDIVEETATAKIFANKDLNIETGDLLNHYSYIAAGNDLTIKAAGKVENYGYQGTIILDDQGADYHYWKYFTRRWYGKWIAAGLGETLSDGQGAAIADSATKYNENTHRVYTIDDYEKLKEEILNSTKIKPDDLPALVQPELLHEIESAILGAVTAISDTPLAVELFKHALQNNPSDLYYPADSDFASAITADPKMSEGLSALLTTARNVSGNDASFALKMDETAFGYNNDGSPFTPKNDLFFALNKFSVLTKADPLPDGGYKVTGVLYDKFDFKPFLERPGFAALLNDTAALLQTVGTIQPFIVKVDFEMVVYPGK
jgi:hypothetical protein